MIFYTGDRILFEKRSIALIGDINLCRQFYLQFHSKLSIEYYFTTYLDYANAAVVDRFCVQTGIKNIVFKQSVIAEKNLLLVLCIEHEFRKPYDKILFNKGLEWGNDYIDSLYIVQYYRHEYNIKLEDKRIWIFGAGYYGRTFYQEYKESYNICGFVSNFEEEKEFEGLPVIRPEKLLEQENTYVVICSEADVIMAEKLEKIGLHGDRNYGFISTLPKKLFVGIGTCQIVDIVDILYKNRNFIHQYYINSYSETAYEVYQPVDCNRIKGYGNFCDVVFYNGANEGTIEQRDCSVIIDRFYKTALKLSMPFYYFAGQLIQATIVPNEYSVRTFNENWFWFRGDKEINSMIENGYSAEEIYEKISDDSYWPAEKVLTNFKKEMKKIEVWDRFSSFPIKKYIEKNYQHITVFTDGTHFDFHLRLYLADEISNRLGIEPKYNQDIIEWLEGMKLTVMPIYPCVRKALGMEDTESRCQFYNIEKGQLEDLDMKEYVKRYVQYIVSIKNIYGKIGTVSRW